MIGLLIKKWFFDLWDNLLPALLMNVAFVLPLAGWLILPGMAGANFWLAFAANLSCFMAGFVLLGAINRFTFDFARAKSFAFSAIPGYIKASAIPSLVLGAAAFALGLFMRVGLPFYTELNPTLGLAVTVFMFWMAFFLLLAGGWWWPLNAQFEPKVPKLVRKCGLLFLDNPGFSLFLFFGGVLITALSVLTLTLFPGVTGLLSWYQTGLKLRMYKYDYLETLPEEEQVNRRKVVIPWETLLAAEREQVGPRSLKSMFFPWKD